MHFRSYTAPLAALAPLTCALPAFGLAHMQAASIDGAQEVPAVATPAIGLGHALIDTSTNTLFYHVEFSGLLGPETAAHIHGFAPSGVGGAGVLHGLPLGTPKIGAWNYLETQEADIMAGLTYFNIHSTVHGGGEIRGQIVVDPATDMVAIIDPLQEVPPNPSPGGQGIGVFDLDTTANTLSYEIRFGNLTGAENNAHIHGFAAPGVNANIKHALVLGNPKIGVWNFLEADEASIVAGLTYVNIHSTFDGAGEIRGQVLPISPPTGVGALPAGAAGLSLVAAPNPAPHGNVALLYRLPEAGRFTVTIHDVAGRTLRTLHDGESDGAGIVAWDTRDAGGALVPAGVYFARVESASGSRSSQVVVLR
jgi:hypothetical protein